MRSKIFALVALVALALAGGQSAHAKSTAPLTQNIYIEMKVQGPPTTGCSTGRAGLPYVITFQFDTDPNWRYQFGVTNSCGFIELHLTPVANSMYYYVKGDRWLSPRGSTTRLCAGPTATVTYTTPTSTTPVIAPATTRAASHTATTS